MQTHQYVRRPFYVEAVQVTDENMAEVAKWCGGSIKTTPHSRAVAKRKFIKVRVYRPMTDKQSTAFVGDWVLYTSSGYKVFTDNAFTGSFEREGAEGWTQADLDRNKSEHIVDHHPGQDELFRSAGSGQFVTQEYAESHPGTTVKESGSRDL